MPATTSTEVPWFEIVTDADAVAHYIDDTTSEVYAMRADAPHFVRVTEDDNAMILTKLTNNRAEVIVGTAHLTNLSQSVTAGTVLAMLED